MTMNCQACGCYGDTRYVELYQNVGVLVMRFSKSVKGNLCRDCISKYFWQLTLVTLFAGWWGVISFIITPFLLINNIYRFIASRSLAPSSHPLGGSRDERLARLRGE